MSLLPERGTYRCFSCGARGSITALLVNKFDVPYFEAAGIVAEQLVMGWEPKEKEKFEISEPWELDVIPSWYKKKGIDAKVLRTFMVGTTEKGWMAIPLYRQRELMGVQYRKEYEKERLIKNNAGFEKSKYIYNYQPAMQEAVYVEGYTDVYRLTMFGEHAEGIMGSSFSNEQAEMASVHELIYIATDNDNAGRRAVEEIAYRMRNYQTDLMVVPYLEKDPGEVVTGRLWRSYKDEATSYAEYTAELTVLDDDYLDRKDKWWNEFRKSDA